MDIVVQFLQTYMNILHINICRAPDVRTILAEDFVFIFHFVYTLDLRARARARVCVCVRVLACFFSSEATSNLIHDIKLVPGLKFWIYAKNRITSV